MGSSAKVLFPVVDEQTLAGLVKELKSTGPAYRQHVSTVMRAFLQPPLQTGDPGLVAGAGVSFQQPDAPTRDPCPRLH